jgi:hypothetical protein
MGDVGQLYLPPAEAACAHGKRMTAHPILRRPHAPILRCGAKETCRRRGGPGPTSGGAACEPRGGATYPQRRQRLSEFSQPVHQKTWVPQYSWPFLQMRAGELLNPALLIVSYRLFIHLLPLLLLTSLPHPQKDHQHRSHHPPPLTALHDNQTADYLQLHPQDGRGQVTYIANDPTN